MYPTSRTFPADPSGLPFGRFGWKSKPAGTRTWFVDGLTGNDANGDTADSPDRALKTIGKAIALATSYDVIYVLDKGLSGTDPNPYQEATANLDVAYAKNNLAIIGVPANMRQVHGLQVKGHASITTTPVLKIHAPFCIVENMQFNRGASTVGGVEVIDNGNTTDQAQGTSIYNCGFLNLRGSGTSAAGLGGGIVVVGGWNYWFEKCVFYNCRTGIYFDSSGSSTTQAPVVKDCDFMGDAASLDADIYTVGGTVILNSLIDNNRFAHAKPTYAGGGGKYVVLLGASSMFSRNFVAKAAADTMGAAGTVGTIPVTFFMVGNMDEGGILART